MSFKLYTFSRLVLVGIVLCPQMYIIGAEDGTCEKKMSGVSACNFDIQFLRTCHWDAPSNNNAAWKYIQPGEHGPLDVGKTKPNGYVYVDPADQKDTSASIENTVSGDVTAMCISFDYATFNSNELELYLNVDSKRNILDNVYLNDTNGLWSYYGMSCCFKMGRITTRKVGFTSKNPRSVVALDNLSFRKSDRSCDNAEDGQCFFLPPPAPTRNTKKGVTVPTPQKEVSTERNPIDQKQLHETSNSPSTRTENDEASVTQKLMTKSTPTVDSYTTTGGLVTKTSEQIPTTMPSPKQEIKRTSPPPPQGTPSSGDMIMQTTGIQLLNNIVIQQVTLSIPTTTLVEEEINNLPVTPNVVSGLSREQVIGVLVGAGVIFLILVLIVVLLSIRCSQRTRRREAKPGPVPNYVTEITTYRKPSLLYACADIKGAENIPSYDDDNSFQSSNQYVSINDLNSNSFPRPNEFNDYDIPRPSPPNTNTTQSPSNVRFLPRLYLQELKRYHSHDSEEGDVSFENPMYST